MKTIKIGRNTIGDGYPLYFIADIGANHDGDLNRALKLIELAESRLISSGIFSRFWQLNTIDFA